MDDYKSRIKLAIEKNAKKHIPKPFKRREHPELIFQKELLNFAPKLGFDLTITNSSHYDGQEAKISETGFSDLTGNRGPLACFVECKAPGNRIPSKVSVEQYNFLHRKIIQGCFACVTDSTKHFEDLWTKFKDLNFNDRIELLLKDLPRPKDLDRYSRVTPLFEE